MATKLYVDECTRLILEYVDDDQLQSIPTRYHCYDTKVVEILKSKIILSH